MAETKWSTPPVLSAVDVAFPAHALDWLPPYKEIPDAFRGYGDPWSKQMQTWFFKGPDAAWIARLTPATPAVNKDAALRALQAILGSFAPKHEHKIAGAAYLASLWFDDPALAKARGE